MGIAEANIAGNVHGGTIMKLCDEVAGIAAIRHSGRRVVTAGVDRMNFLHPVLVGDLVIVRATVNAAWRTSMEVGVRVEREHVRTGEVEHTSTAYLTMVALDEEGRPAGDTDRRPERGGATARARGRAAAAQPVERAAGDGGKSGCAVATGSGSIASERFDVVADPAQGAASVPAGDAGSPPASARSSSPAARQKKNPSAANMMTRSTTIISPPPICWSAIGVSP